MESYVYYEVFLLIFHEMELSLASATHKLRLVDNQDKLDKQHGVDYLPTGI